MQNNEPKINDFDVGPGQIHADHLPLVAPVIGILCGAFLIPLLVTTVIQLVRMAY